MIVYTLQPKKILDIIDEKGIYVPDFGKSEYLKKMPELKDIYDFVLECFNRNNGCNLSSLIFTFVPSDGQFCRYDPEIGHIVNHFCNHHAEIDSLWRELISREDVILYQLQYDENAFNPIAIGMNDFQYIMPPVIPMPPYLEGDDKMIKGMMMRGNVDRFMVQSYIYQYCVPYIKRENIMGLFRPFTLER